MLDWALSHADELAKLSAVAGAMAGAAWAALIYMHKRFLAHLKEHFSTKTEVDKLAVGVEILAISVQDLSTHVSALNIKQQ